MQLTEEAMGKGVNSHPQLKVFDQCNQGNSAPRIKFMLLVFVLLIVIFVQRVQKRFPKTLIVILFVLMRGMLLNMLYLQVNCFVIYNFTAS